MIERCPYPRPTAETVCSLEGLLYFVWEREAIRYAREFELPREEWTSDSIFKKYKFTNIRRRDDRVSRWVIEHIIKPREHSPHLWFNLLTARLINWPPTLQHLIDEGLMFRKPAEFDPEAFSRSIEQYKVGRSKVYTGSYMVYPTKMDPGSVKSLSVARHIITPAAGLAEPLQRIIAAEQPLLAEFVKTLSTGFGISTFIAGQVAADLTYSAQLGDAADLYTYAPIGPGSSRGLNYLHHRKPFATWSQCEFNAALIDVKQAIVERLDITDLTLHDVQNVMCEYSKYVRTALGEGVPKTTYKPETEF